MHFRGLVVSQINLATSNNFGRSLNAFRSPRGVPDTFRDLKRFLKVLECISEVSRGPRIISGPQTPSEGPQMHFGGLEGPQLNFATSNDF